MTAELYANNFSTTLSGNGGSITSGATSLKTAAAAPAALQAAGQWRILIDSELMVVTAGGATTTWTVSRGAEGTSAASHNDGATVTHVLTASALLAIVQQNAPAAGAAFGASQVVKSGAYTVKLTDETVYGDATGGAFTIGLPNVASVTGHYNVAALQTNSNLITLAAASSSQLIGPFSSASVTLGALSAGANLNAGILLPTPSMSWQVF